MPCAQILRLRSALFRDSCRLVLAIGMQVRTQCPVLLKHSFRRTHRSALTECSGLRSACSTCTRHEFAPGISFVITDAGGLTLSDALVRPEGDDARIVRNALTVLSTGSASRVGRLLAPLGVRFVAIPLVDGIASTFDDPVNPPDGLSLALAAQLDIGVIQSPPQIEAFVNRSWIPPAAFLTGGAANASRNAGAGSLLLADLDGIAAVELAGDGGEEFVDAVMGQGPQVLSVPSEGVLHLGIPFDERWRVTLDGAGLLPRAGFARPLHLTSRAEARSPCLTMP